ncbi:MAG: porphobilinogen synthase [Nitrososphaerota archaeon]|nr:porphobilinogen synthase [Nitrososphaerota archaeon]
MSEGFAPRSRPRRLRRTENIRRMVQETRLHPSSFMVPVFVKAGGGEEEVESMPGVRRHTVDGLVKHASSLLDAGLSSVLLFGIPEGKDDAGSQAYSKDGIVPAAVRRLKKEHPDMVVAADVCLCEYTSHGHCGVLGGGSVDNDRTLGLLARAAVEYARAGADMVAPSAMMDGQVGAIRAALDGEGFGETAIMAYSAKHASAFYGPFRDAAGSAPSFGDRAAYQMRPGNLREAMREMDLDIREGADIVMVKPALAYLDLISEARRRYDVPLAAYNVSGEYSMVKAAATNGWLDERQAVMEVLTAIRRAGADLIITYHAVQAVGWL